MNETSFPEFGDMKFIYGWVKEADIIVGKSKYKILIEASATKYQDINELQQKAYKKYIRSQKSILNELNNALMNPAIADGEFKPISIIFDRDGGISARLESKLDYSIRCDYRFIPKSGFEHLSSIN